MKTYIFAVIFLAITSICWAFQLNPGGFAPALGREVKLTVAAKVIDMSDDTAWEVIPPSGCTFKVLSSPTNVGIAHPMVASVLNVRYVSHRKHGVSFGNHSTAFILFTNCTSAIVERY
jgi:hypothetical protein